jgi:flagellin-like hook-associated protein FlgL
MKKSVYISQVQTANGYISQAIDVLQGIKAELLEGFHSDEALEDVEYLITELEHLEGQAENIAPHCE